MYPDPKWSKQKRQKLLKFSVTGGVSGRSIFSQIQATLCISSKIKTPTLCPVPWYGDSYFTIIMFSRMEPSVLCPFCHANSKTVGWYFGLFTLLTLHWLAGSVPLLWGTWDYNWKLGWNEHLSFGFKLIGNLYSLQNNKFCFRVYFVDNVCIHQITTVEWRT